MLTAIVGINWGDEGKGRMVDLLAAHQQVVVRYQGGNNAGHTVVNERGKFVLNLLPSGILHPNVVNVMGNGMVIDLEHLTQEVERLRAAGVAISPENLKISDRAVLCLPYHVQQDCLEEDRLGAAKFGSTRRGIGPVYGDKYLKKCLRAGDLLYPDYLKKRLWPIVEWKDLTIHRAYGAPSLHPEALLDWLHTYGDPFRSYICDTGAYLDEALASGKEVMTEAQLGALRDIDFGIYPFTSSSSTIAAYAPVGAGVPGHPLERVVGVMKAYSSCVGEGPFPVELFGPEGETLRAAGGEYGAATGRPRRVGPFDAVASRYGVKVQGATELALTKLDVLSYLDRIPLCVAYEVDGVRTTAFPVGAPLEQAKPVYETLPGWKQDISHCRTVEDLPSEVLTYVRRLEREVDCPIRYLSVGAQRDAYIEL